jgi:putative two-component system response regulator
MSFLFLFLLQLGFFAPSAAPVVVDGTLDLRGWDFAQGTIRLDGNWRFNPGLSDGPDGHRLLQPVPGYLPDTPGVPRIGTYHLRVLFPTDVPRILALRPIRPSSQCLRVLVDGVEQGGIGTFGTSATGSVPVFSSRPVFLQASPGAHDLTIEAAWFHLPSCGIARPFELGSASDCTRAQGRSDSFNTFLAGSLFFLGLQFAVYWWYRRKDPSTGLFSLISLTSLVRHLATTSSPLTESLPWFDWEVHLRLEYLTFGTLVLWVYWFTCELFPRHLSQRFLTFLQVSGGLYAFFSLVASPRWIVASVWYYQAIHLAVIPMLLFALVRAAARREPGAAIYLLGFAVLAGTVVNDLLYAWHLVNSGLWAPAGMLALVVALSVASSRRTSQRTNRLEAGLEQRLLDIASLWERIHPGFVGHQERVAHLSALLCRALGLPVDEIDRIRRAALHHDAAMVEIPESVLLKPSSLTHAEYLLMQGHLTVPSLSYSRDGHGTDKAVIGSHHEHWDGSGKPYGLAGEQIPLPARIVAVADIWDALTHDRPHRTALTPQDALEQLERERGRTLDPRLLDLFLEQGIWKATLPGLPPPSSRPGLD